MFLRLFLTTALIFSGMPLQAQTAIKGPALIEGTTTITAAAGTTTLTKDSNPVQIINGTTTQTIVMPSATTLPVGRSFEFYSTTTNVVTINANGGTLLKSLSPNEHSKFRLTANGTAAGTWAVENNAAVNVAQGYNYGIMKQAGATSCFRSSGALTNETTYVAMGAASGGCVAPTTVGPVSNPSPNTLQMVMGPGAAGVYTFRLSALLNASTNSNICNFRFTDGTTSFGILTVYAGAAAASGSPLVGTITFPAFTSKTITIQVSGTSGNSCYVNNDQAGRDVEWSVDYTPSQSQSVVKMSELRAPTISTVGISSHTGGFSANGSGNYVPPAGVTNISVRLVGGGAGGGGNSSGGTDGGVTTFGTSLLTANGGTGGAQTAGVASGVGGSATIAAPAQGTATTGSDGIPGSPTATSNGGSGGNSCFAGAGKPGIANNGSGIAAKADTGSGGGGGSGTSTSGAGGGGAGGCVNARLSVTPGVAIPFSVGAGGAGGSGTGAGGAGAGGWIEVTEFYGWNLPIIIDLPPTGSQFTFAGISPSSGANTTSASGTQTITLSRPGFSGSFKWKMTLNSSTAHSQAYSFERVSWSLGGTATRQDIFGSAPTVEGIEAGDANTNASLVIYGTATSGQTLTVSFAYQCNYSASGHNANGGYLLEYLP